MSKESRQRAQTVRTPAPTGQLSCLSPAVLLPLFLLVVVTIVTYWPVLHHRFVYYDDDVYVTENVHVLQGLTLPSIGWAFSTLHAGFWHPLTWLSLMLDTTLSGEWIGGYHLTNLVLHVANAVLLFLLLVRLTGARGRSLAVAALFALHPLHVESVAWVAERKDVLSTFFGFLSLWFYTRHVQSRERTGNQKPETRNSRWYWLSLAAFVLGLMSKSMLISWPLLMLLLDFWPLERVSGSPFRFSSWKPLLVEKIPFLAIAFLAGLITLVAESKIGAVSIGQQNPLPLRAANAVVSCAWYLVDIFWTSRLAVFYPWPKTIAWLPALALALLFLLVSVAVIMQARKRGYLLLGWYWYLIALLPVSGLLRVGEHSRADRYTYVPLIGVFIMLVWGIHALSQSWSLPQTVRRLAGLVVVSLLVLATRQQLKYWETSETLFRHAIAVTDGNYVAENNLGKYLYFEGRTDEAIASYRSALTIKPGYTTALVNLGAALSDSGRRDEAMACYEEVLKTDPNHIGALNNLGTLLAGKEQYAAAAEKFTAVLKLDSGQNATRVNLGIILLQLGRTDEAIARFREALQHDPHDTRAASELEGALSAQHAH